MRRETHRCGDKRTIRRQRYNAVLGAPVSTANTIDTGAVATVVTLESSMAEESLFRDSSSSTTIATYGWRLCDDGERCGRDQITYYFKCKLTTSRNIQ